MGFPAYLLGISIPLAAGLAMGLFVLKMMQQNQPRPISYREEGTRQTFEWQSVFSEKEEERKKRASGKCSICLEIMTSENAQFVKCNHVFHSKCIEELHKHNIKDCPNCRAKIL